ncbi:MAG: aa3-type cytochrome oxidase subunit IV [Microbacterium gubbeenense]|uniref:aa3-type cytochrome oxidase subunit IV n=3 Tax=Microbacterium gubbeenense TaxID=159896 RepID=UPI003F96B11E
MKTNIVIWWMLAVFFFVCFAGYAVWNIVDHGGVEWIGTVVFLFAAFMTGLIGFFVTALHRGQKGVELPEDRLDVGIDDADPEVGEFAPWSWWPIVLAAAPAVGVLGLATAHFLLPLAAALLVIGLVGWVYEYYRGNFAR